MKQPKLAHDLVPVGDFRSDLSSWLKKTGETRRPLVVTQRGRAAAVVVSPEVMDELEEERAFMKAVVRGLKDIEDGRLSDDDDVWSEIDDILRGAGADPLD